MTSGEFDTELIHVKDIDINNCGFLGRNTVLKVWK